MISNRSQAFVEIVQNNDTTTRACYHNEVERSYWPFVQRKPCPICRFLFQASLIVFSF